MTNNMNYQELYDEYKLLVKHISWKDAIQILEQNSQARLIDVRELHEWQAGHAPNAIHTPRSNLINSINQAITDKNTMVLVYCARGIRSVIACYELQQAGFTNVCSIDEGILGMV